MTAPFWSFPIRSRRDLLTARSHARSIARMLRFEEPDQIAIAASVFLACSHAYAAWKRHRIIFVIEDRCLRIEPIHPKRPAEPAPWAVRKAFSSQMSCPPTEDLAWLTRQICGVATVHPFEEIARQNDEILRLLIALRERNAGRGLPEIPGSPKAAA